MSFSTFIAPADNNGVGVAFTDREYPSEFLPNDSFDLSCESEEEFAHNIAALRSFVDCDQLAFCEQVHGTNVEQVDLSGIDDEHGCHHTGEADAMVATTPGVALVIRVADCIPVLLADTQAQVIGAVHAGRVGLLAGVLQQGIAEMTANGAKNIHAWVGPHICAGCYEVPREMAEDAWAVLRASKAQSWQGTPAIDLGAGAESILTSHGVTVTRLDPCTRCNPQFFSHRRDQGHPGRQAGIIWLKT
ncbi:MAG: peptidoglycan editing factor PgeF [Propionibacteriaceae bacterium]|nr:peptidoglycan editing factor PgeF [Propionibacteriaceae bacterium]